MLVRFAHALALVAALSGGSLVGAQTLREYQAKGAFLVNFARFIEWPAEAFKGPEAPVDLCVVAEQWIYEDIQTTVKNKLIGARPLRLRQPGESAQCHLLFISGDRVPGGLFQSVSDYTVTVGEQPRFIGAGGHINFHLHGDRIHFEIASGAVQQKRFRMSSKLLVLADKGEN